LLLILLAHTIFSLGIWNARDGYGEDTSDVIVAFQVIQTHHPVSSLYIDLIALSLKFFTPDPVTALTFMKYLSSLMATMAIYLGLSSFSKYLRQSAIVFACFVWIACSLDAPILQSTSHSLFAFAIMLFGIDCLLLGESIWSLLGFYIFGGMAMLLRPEYTLPVAVLTVVLAGWAVLCGAKIVEVRFGLSRHWVFGGILCFALTIGTALWLRPPAPMLSELNGLDRYTLFGLGQCYADFYHREHPEQIFSPMTEYQGLLDQKFGKPASFIAAVRNNPLELLRYCTLNTGRNLRKNMPGALLDSYREQPGRHHRNVLYWLVRVILFPGAVIGALRLCRFGWKRDDFSFGSICASMRRNSTRRKLFLLLLLLSTSSLAVVLLVGTPRYFLGWTPLFYLGVAFCADSLLRAFSLIRYESLLVALSFLFLCAPNYLVPRPNYEFDAVRHVAPYVKDYPTVGAWWADPDTVLALGEKAKALSISDGIHPADIESGKIDILMVDANFRETKTWADQRDFFEQFERQPEAFGYKKAAGIPTGRFDIYYKPKPVTIFTRREKSE